jgi:ABC-type branched-subunit amino acid transport system substrate-binding protein
MQYLNRPTGIKTLVVGLVTAMALTACGQKPGVHVDGGVAAPGTNLGGTTTGTVEGTTDATLGSEGTDGVGTSDGSTGGTVGTTGGSTGGSTGGTSGGSTGTTGGSTGGSTGGTTGTTGGTTGGSTTGGTSGGTSGGTQPGGSDMTGVSAETIIMGLHAPVSGAAPVPAEEFRDNQNLYWDYMFEKKNVTFMGRRVQVAFEDDQYNRGTAQQKCSQLVDKSFLLVGGAGTDQIQACGALANQREVPYISAGVTENGLKGLPWYFAASMSYAQQADLLAKYIKKNFPGEKVAMVVTNTPNFEDAWVSFEQAAQANGLDYAGTFKHEKGDQTWYGQFALNLSGANVGVVYPLTAPTDWIGFATQAEKQGYTPQWAGVGITMGLNKIISTGCNSAPSMDGARFFSPYPELDVIDQLDPEFRQAAEAYGIAVTDIGLTLWGINKTIAQLLKVYEKTYGPDANLTREAFRALMENTQGVKTNIFPTLDYSPQDHFGASEVHVLEADCSQGQYVTLETFKRTF